MPASGLSGNGDYLQYLCSDCAEDLGGTWPDGHLATMHEGYCDVCGEKSALSHMTDWEWPGVVAPYCDATGREL